MQRPWRKLGMLAVAVCVIGGTAYAASPTGGEGDQKHQQGQQQGQHMQQDQPASSAQNTGADLTGGRDKHLGPQGGAAGGSQEGMRTGRKGQDADEAAHGSMKQGDEKMTSPERSRSGQRSTGEASGKMSQGQQGEHTQGDTHQGGSGRQGTH